MENIKKKKKKGKKEKKKTILHRVARSYVHAAQRERERESGAPADPLKSIPFRLVDRNAISAA
jgi:hypothetical protein